MTRRGARKELARRSTDWFTERVDTLKLKEATS